MIFSDRLVLHDLHYLRQGGYVFGAVYLFVCQQDYAKSYKRILIKFSGYVGLGPMTNPLDFGSDPDADPDVITLYPDSYSSWRVLAATNVFLVESPIT